MDVQIFAHVVQHPLTCHFEKGMVQKMIKKNLCVIYTNQRLRCQLAVHIYCILRLLIFCLYLPLISIKGLAFLLYAIYKYFICHEGCNNNCCPVYEEQSFETCMVHSQKTIPQCFFTLQVACVCIETFEVYVFIFMNTPSHDFEYKLFYINIMVHGLSFK